MGAHAPGSSSCLALDAVIRQIQEACDEANRLGEQKVASELLADRLYRFLVDDARDDSERIPESRAALFLVRLAKMVISGVPVTEHTKKAELACAAGKLGLNLFHQGREGKV